MSKREFFVQRRVFPVRGAALAICCVSVVFGWQMNKHGAPQRADAPEGMVWIPGGDFWMGSDEPMFPDARPVHRVYVDGFWIDRTTVTNKQFAAFVKATGYVTAAERAADPAQYPG